MSSKIIKAFIDPWYFWQGILKKMSQFIPNDKIYISIRYYLSFKHKINWNNPKTYNEKQQWLKLYDRDERYTMMADKFLVKKYIAEQLGIEYVIPTIGVWDKPEDIVWDDLPDSFVMKCNHNSGTGMIICKNKSQLNIQEAVKNLKKGLKENYYIRNREWCYKNINRKIIAEKFMVDSEYGELRDYKFFCFNGEVKFLFIATDRSKGDHAVCFDFFDAEFNHLPFTHGHPNAKILPKKPAMFEDMKKIASKLSAGIPSVRVDLYEINGKIYFGELTFTHWGGFMPFEPPEYDYILGEFIKLPFNEKNNS